MNNVLPTILRCVLQLPRCRWVTSVCCLPGGRVLSGGMCPQSLQPTDYPSVFATRPATAPLQVGDLCMLLAWRQSAVRRHVR
jgi:hypothetical protein